MEIESTSEQLRQRLSSVDFNQLLRCLQVESGVQIGMERVLSKQVVKLVAELSHNFPSNELSEWSSDGDRRPRLSVAFFGLFGPRGSLPNHYTELILERIRNKDFSLREFLDIFNHRALSLFYRSWEKHSFPIAYETAKASDVEDTVTKALLAIVGNRIESSRNRMSFEDDSLLYYGGQFASRRPSVASLQDCVADFTGLATEVEPLVGQWLTIPPMERTIIGNHLPESSFGGCLGVDTIVGDRVWDIENRFRVNVGPTDWETFSTYLPNKSKLRILSDFVRRYVGPQFDFDIRIMVQKNEVRGCVLDGRTNFSLGWNTWLGERRTSKDADEAIFELSDIGPTIL